MMNQESRKQPAGTGKGKLPILGIVFLVVLVLSWALLLWQLTGLGMLPGLYLWLLAAAALIVTLPLACLLLTSPKQKGKFGSTTPRIPARRWVGCVLALLLSIGCLVGANAVGLAQQTMDAVMEQTIVSDVIGVYTLADDPAASLEDAKDYRFAITESYDFENTEKALNGMAEELGAPLQTQRYDHVFAMIEALYLGDADAIILNTAYLSILEEMEPYQNFREQVKEIHQFAIEETIIIETQPPTVPPTQDSASGETQPPTEPEPITMEPFVLYLSGSDTRNKKLVTSRSDVNILAVVNPETKQVLLLNTPRDYYIPNPAGGGRLDKLTHCGVYGVDCSMKALGDLYGVTVDHYAQINFTGFETLIDAIGGVTVYSEKAFSTPTPAATYYYQEGENFLNGAEALAFARNRYSFADGDHARGRNQMRVITGVLNKLTSGSTILTRYADILKSMEGTFITSVSQEMMGDIAKMQLQDMATWNIQSYAVTGYGDSQTTYSAPSYFCYVMQPDRSTVRKASALIQQVLNGETINLDITVD